jgi:hypothetical protein
LRRSKVPVRLCGDEVNMAAPAKRDPALIGPRRVLGSWLWKIEDGTLRASPAIARAFRVDPERAKIGLPLDDYIHAVHPDDREAFDIEVSKAVAVSGEFWAEYRVVAHDGSVRWLWDRGQCVVSKAGRPIEYMGVVIDITFGAHHDLDDAADHLMAAREIAAAAGQNDLRFMIDMALLEVGRVAPHEQARLSPGSER